MIIHIYIHIIVYNNLLVIPNPKSEAPNPAPFSLQAPLSSSAQDDARHLHLPNLGQLKFRWISPEIGGNSNEKPCNPGLMA